MDMTSYSATLEENGLEVMSLSSSCESYRGCMLYTSVLLWVLYYCNNGLYAYSYGVVLEPMQLIQREICILTAYPSIGWRSLEDRYWHEQIPAPKNVTIIRWLDQHNIN